MNAATTLRAPRLPLLALAALAALLAAAAIFTLGGGAQAAVGSAQRGAQLNLSLIDDSDNIVPAGSTIAVAATITFTVDAIDPDNNGVYDEHGPFGEPFYLQSGGRFRLTGNLEWEGPGRAALTLDERATSDADVDLAADDGKLDDTRLCAARTEDAVTTWTCTLSIKHGSTVRGTAVTGGDDNTIVIPEGRPDGPFTISGTVKIDDAAGSGSASDAVELHDSLTVTVGKVLEVQTATLDFATQAEDNLSPNGRAGDPWPSTVAAIGSETRLELSLLNSAGAASATGSISSAHFFTTTGRLSSVTLGAGACRGGDGQSICELDVSRLNSTNSDSIEIRVEPPLTQTARTALVRGTLLTADGRTFALGPLQIRFTGLPVALNIQEPTSSILNTQTLDDNRDQLTLAVTAVDSIGNPILAPTSRLRATLTDPDGKKTIPTRTVTTTLQDQPGFREGEVRRISVTFDTIRVDWPLRQGTGGGLALDSEGRLQAKVTVLAAEDSPLKTGMWTLELSADGLTAKQTFIVGEKAASLTLGEPQGTLDLGEQVTLTATVLDAKDNPVPDGTPVEWSATDIGTTAVMVRLSADAATTGGKASARWLVLSAGRATVRADAGGNATDLRLLDIAAAIAAGIEPYGPADDLSNGGQPGFNTWSGEGSASGSTTAAALLDDLEGANGILLWAGAAGWLRYARSDGQIIPGSFDFHVTGGAILWLAE